jgi:hypothetical protein
MITDTDKCKCVTYDDDLGEWEPAPECWGDCNNYNEKDK